MNTHNGILSSSPIVVVDLQDTTALQAPFEVCDQLGSSTAEDMAGQELIDCRETSLQWQSQDIAQRMSQMKSLKIESEHIEQKVAPTAFIVQANGAVVLQQQNSFAAAKIQRAWRCKLIQQKFRQHKSKMGIRIRSENEYRFDRG